MAQHLRQKEHVARKSQQVDLLAEDAVPVMLPSGDVWRVYPREVSAYNERVSKYRKDFSLTNVSDLSELDRIVQYETLIQRWMTWMGDNADYWGEGISVSQLSDDCKKVSVEIRLLKAALGIDKVTREKTMGDESVAARWTDLTKRAGEFMQMRDEQFDKTLELFHKLKATLILRANCTEDERKSQHCTTEDIFKWLEEDAIPEFDKIDEHFRNKPDGQKHWLAHINR